MRSKRLRKFRKKNRSLMIVLKMSFIFYLLLFTAGYVMSSTTAYFSSEVNVRQQITSATWSDLDFVNVDSRTDETCIVTATLTNKGEAAMEEPTFYEVYYAKEGEPKTDGGPERLAEGEDVIEVLEPDETVSLTYTVTKPGAYQFVAEQHDDHPDGQTIWSDKISVECETDSDETKANHDKEEEVESLEETNVATPDDTGEHQNKTETEPVEEDDETEATDGEDVKEESEDTSDEQEQTDKLDNDEVKSPKEPDSEETQDKSENIATTKSKSKDPEDENLEKKTKESTEDPKDTEEANTSEKAEGDEMAQ